MPSSMPFMFNAYSLSIVILIPNACLVEDLYEQFPSIYITFQFLRTSGGSLVAEYLSRKLWTQSPGWLNR